uniref:Phosphodiesterase n=1 Tax=Percolomonas cosmopolitus TaxID=63605 RepID=A0A7S1KLP0_9EUKA|mmetsp:Transcript_10731/g.40186  ORF Transcript_10731/g.40186 Transcript_10731/m.40186 type:complete len:939 (+) Transcript_10731:539-3355(+)|eukprot:CAMPEP_0117443614 /NCGR_PEP_ID=MMETSP0759-20121206/4785_1 /TAXON_ID=63605 /ORGANISM="Percolomonas cosmopolitus, Strain WS" /LENGTH=938 /DNA_ID=CAMNT_0005235593 /DNA_START=497 /DNA_END=3313 /DNA_ORIENTATION=-
MGQICTKRTSPWDPANINFSTIVPRETTEDKQYYNPYLEPVFTCIPHLGLLESQTSERLSVGASTPTPISRNDHHQDSVPSIESGTVVDDDEVVSFTAVNGFSASLSTPVGERSRSPSLRGAASPDQISVGFIPKERCVIVIVGHLKIETQWKWTAISWRECMQYARLLWRKRYQLDDEGNPEMIKNQDQQRQQWNVFKTELEKCFWRRDLRFNAEKNTIELNFLELGTNLSWEGFVPVHFDVARVEVLPNLFAAYKDFWDYKVAVERKKDIAQKHREELEHTHKELRDARRQIKELEIENSKLQDDLQNNATNALRRRSSSVAAASRLNRANSIFSKETPQQLTVDVDSDEDDFDDEDDSSPLECPTPTNISTLHSSLFNKRRQDNDDGAQSPSSPPLSPRSSRPGTADSETQMLSRNLPVNRVLSMLRKVRKAATPSNRDRIDYICDVIKNDMLYEVDVDTLAKDEMDSETRSWIKTEFKLEHVSDTKTPTSRWKAYARMITFAKALHKDSSLRIAKRKDEEIVLDIPPEVEECLVDIDSMTKFDIFKLDKVSSHRSLYYVGLALFRKYKFFTRFNISVPRLKHFLLSLENGYLLNPYHNKLHAADVTQCVHSILQTGNILSYLTDLDIFSIILAALVHDFKHPGRTNAFEMKKLTERALMFNDQSILENYHCTEAFKLLGHEKNNILLNLKDHEYRYVRNMLISLVLSTDITHHFTIISQAQSSIIKKFNKAKKEDVTLLLRLILKCSDVSNPARPIHFAKKWAERIMEEFFEQGDEEKKLRYPVSPFMDREKSAIETCQCGFIAYICKPLYDCLQKFNSDCVVYYQQLGANEREWQRVAKEKQAAELKDEELEANYQKTHNIQKVEETEGEEGEAVDVAAAEEKKEDGNDNQPATGAASSPTNDESDEEQKPAVKTSTAAFAKPEPSISPGTTS